MTGQTDLRHLLRSMRPSLRDGVFVFATVPHGTPPPAAVTPLMAFREDEGTTLVVPAEEAERAGLAGTFPCRLITLEVHSALEAVGFLAAVTARLAAASIAVNPVSAFFHDHLFVPADRAAEALRLVEGLAVGEATDP